MPKQKFPKVLYHYTSLETLTKIVSSKELWATNIAYLNDHSEREFFWNEVKKHLPQLLDQNNDLDRRGTLLMMEHFPSQPLASLPFTTSFSSNGDSLPQWRSYCPQSTGVAIGFDLTSLWNARIKRATDEGYQLSVRDDIVLEKISYLKQGSKKFATIAERALAEAREDRDMFYASSAAAPSVAILFFFALERLSAIVKSIAFKEENEFRLVVKPKQTDKETLNFRSSQTTLVPYLRLELPAVESEAKLISEVIVGPSPSQPLTVKAIKAMMEQFGFDIPIKPSDIPFRGWL